MNEHNIENFMKLVTNGKGTIDRESKSDYYYRNVYKEITSGKKVCWNWAAAFFGLSWLLYRKMFKLSFLYAVYVVLAVILLAILLIVTSPPRIVFISAVLVTAFLTFGGLGIFGNWLYVRHIHEKIDKGYHLCQMKNTSTLLGCLSIIAPLNILALLFTPFIAWNDKRKVRKVLAAQSLTE